MTTTGTSSRSCFFRLVGRLLKIKLAALIVGVLVMAGCVTEPPPTTPADLAPSLRAVEEPTRAPTWTAWPKPTKVEPRVAELKEWYRALGKAGPVRGVSMSGVDESHRRIEIWMLPLRGARDQMEATIARANVPREAVAIDVGCPDGGLWRLDNIGRAPVEEFLDAIDYSLEAASTAPYGHTVLLKLTLTNTSDEPVQFFTGSRPPHGFIITTADGEDLELAVRTHQAIASGRQNVAARRGAGVRRRVGAGGQPGRAGPCRRLPDQKRPGNGGP